MKKLSEKPNHQFSFIKTCAIVKGIPFLKHASAENFSPGFVVLDFKSEQFDGKWT